MNTKYSKYNEDLIFLDLIRRRGRPKSTWKRKVEEEVKKLGLEKEDALDREKWRRAVWKCSQMG